MIKYFWIFLLFSMSLRAADKSATVQTAIPAEDVVFLFSFDTTDPLSTEQGAGFKLSTGPDASVEAEGVAGNGLTIAPASSPDDSTGYVQLPRSIAEQLPVHTFSFDFFFRPSEQFLHEKAGIVYFVDQRYTDNTGFQLRYSLKKETLGVTIGNGKETLSATSEQVSLIPNQWRHFAFTYDSTSGTLRLFLDGVELVSETEATFGDIDFGQRPLRIGNRLGSTYGSAVGTFDNIRISRIVVDFSQIHP